MKSPAVNLKWTAPPGCPSAAELDALFERGPPISPPLVIEATIEREDDEFVLVLKVHAATPLFQRTLRADDCSVLVDSAVWLVRLVAAQLRENTTEHALPSLPAAVAEAPARPVDTPYGSTAPPQPEAPSAGDRKSAPPPASTPFSVDMQPTRSTNTPAQSADTSLSEPPRPLHYRAGLALGILDVGLGAAAPAASLNLSIVPAPFVIELRVGAAFQPTRAPIAGAELSFRTLSMLLAGCAEWGQGALRAGPCALVSTLVALPDHSGLIGGKTDAVPWVTAGAAIRTALRLDSRWLISLDAGLMLALSPRPSFEIESKSVARVALATSYAQIGGAFELW